MNILRFPKLTATLLALALPLHAQEVGVTPGEIAFSQIAALDGPAAQLGLGMRKGLLAAFGEINEAGGVNGRTLTLDSRDDGYEPDRSIAQINSVIDENAFFAILGTVGTPTNKVLQPLATEAGIPLLGPFTGAGFLRNPENENVYNVRGTYDAETEEWIKQLVDVEGLTNIAILYQDDAFGNVGLKGVEQALTRRGMQLSARGSYTRNTTDVKDALVAMMEVDPQAVVMVGAYQPIGEFIKLARTFSFTPEFVTISFVGSQALADELWPEGAGVLISQVVPFPWDDSIGIVADYQAAMNVYEEYASYDFVSLEGYIVGRVAIEALKNAGENPTRDSYLAALQGLTNLDLGGLTISYGSGDNQGSDTIFMTRLLPDGFFEPL